MNTSAEAADQVVRIALNGTETALKITGAGAEKVAKLLYNLTKDLIKETKKTQGQMRLSNMIKSGKKLEIFEIPDGNLQRFCELAKAYGVTYCILKDKNASDGLTEIMVKADDSQKINHIFRRLEMAVENVGTVETETGREPKAPERASAEKSKEDKFLDELMQKPAPNHEEAQNTNPTMARTTDQSQSVPSSATKGESSVATKTERDPASERPSVRKQLKEYKDEEKAAEKSKTPEKAKGKNEHKEPAKKKKPKAKERG